MVGGLTALALFAGALVPSAQAAVVWYVAPDGSDSNSCASAASPCLTVNGAIGKASAGDEIDVAVGTYTGSGNNVVVVNKSVRLSGGWNRAFTQLTGLSTVDGQQARRDVSVVGVGTTAIVARFELVNGIQPSFEAFGGGGILSEGTLTLDESYVHNNASSGILTVGPLTVTKSTVAGNQGGGISVSLNSVAVSITNSTIANNTASQGGGGAGVALNFIFGASVLALNGDTISGNSTPFGMGGGIFVSSGWQLHLQNTIVSRNSAAFGDNVFAASFNASAVSGGYNIGTGFLPTTGDMQGNPALGSLGDNGGPTPTMALLPGSPAIDAIPPGVNGCGTTLTTDQRGVSRPQGSGCDTGAFELVADTTPPVITVPGAITANATSPKGAVVTYAVSATDPDDAVASLTCSPASGSTFPIGTTTVTCTATDTHGNSSTASFTVHVEGAAEQLADLAKAAAGIKPLATLSEKAKAAQSARELRKTCALLTAFVSTAQGLSGYTIPPAQAQTLIASANRIMNVLGC